MNPRTLRTGLSLVLRWWSCHTRAVLDSSGVLCEARNGLLMHCFIDLTLERDSQRTSLEASFFGDLEMFFSQLLQLLVDQNGRDSADPKCLAESLRIHEH